MGGPLEEEYFNWLCAMVIDVPPPTYRGVMTILHQTEFIWIVPEDENRAADGHALRKQFCQEVGVDPNSFWLGCSVLEMLIALTTRTEFQTDIPAKDWFWMMLANLKIDEYPIVYKSEISNIEDILNRFLWRTYSPDGVGGLFPLRNPRYDERGVELWYQFCEYVQEQGLI